MCARLLACPLCSQPGFLTLDSLRAGLVSVATRPLACPVCNEVLLGIDKLTIHLFGHTVSAGNTPVGGGNESAKLMEVANNAQMMRNAIQSWNVLNAQTVDSNNVQVKDAARDNTGSGIYIPIDEIENFRNLTAIKDGNGIIPVQNTQNITTEMKAPSQVIVLQNVGSQPQLFSADLIDHQIVNPPTNLYQTSNTTTAAVPTNVVAEQNPLNADVIEIPSENVERDKNTQTSWTDTPNPPQPPPTFHRSHTDRLEELVKSAQITSSPLGTFHEAYDCSRPETPPPQPVEPTPAAPSNKPQIKSTVILAECMERCNICGISFPGRNVLLLHKQLVHMIKEKDANVSPDDLMKNYPCHLCTKIFKMRGSLMVHMRVAHPGVNVPRAIVPPPELNKPSEPEPAIEEPEGNFNCPTCGKAFKKESQMTQHMRIHEIKQFECDVCSKMFTTKYFLKKHKRLHSGEMPYKCNICDKTFTFQQSYHKHRLYHKDDKPHTCNTCGRSFKELSTLHNHERIHTGEKPYACESCGKCFRQRVSYLVHRRIHTGAMPYRCLACGKSFRYKVSQRTHKCPMQSQETPEQPSNEVSQSSPIQNGNNDVHEVFEVSSQDEHSMDESVTSEDNQYILVLGNDGQHVLKKKSEIDNNETNDKSKDNNNDESNGMMENIWSSSQDQMEFKDSNTKTTWNDKPINDNNNSNDLWTQIASVGATSPSKPNDFLSMILDNEISSPATEMEHLRLSSPVSNNHQENTSEANDGFPSPPVAVQRVDQEESFDGNNLSTLQNINEDSLKELLNSIADK